MEWYLIAVMFIAGADSAVVLSGPLTGTDCIAQAEAMAYGSNVQLSCEVAR